MAGKVKTPNDLLREVVENRGHSSLRDLWLDFLTYLRARNYTHLDAFAPQDTVDTAELYIRAGVLDQLDREEESMEAAWFGDFNRRPRLRVAVDEFLIHRSLNRFIDKSF